MQQAGRKIELLFPRGIKLGNSQLLVCEILQLQRTVWTKWYLWSGQTSKLHLPSLEDLSDKPLVLQSKKCWKVGTSGCSSKDLSTSTHASVLLGKYCYMELFCFKHIHFLYNEEHFSLWKINELTFFFSFRLWKSLEKHKGRSQTLFREAQSPRNCLCGYQENVVGFSSLGSGSCALRAGDRGDNPSSSWWVVESEP